MEQEDEFEPQFKISAGDLPKVHKNINHNRPYSSPHVSPETTIPSTTAPETMRRPEEDAGEAEAAADWVVGGPVGSKGAVLVFRSCVLASRTPSMESTAKSVGNNTGTKILLNKAKNMAKRLVAEPHPFNVRPKNIMHDVMETFGGSQSQKYAGQAYVVRHASEGEVPDDGGRGAEDRGGPAEHQRDIEDVLNDLNKITLKTHRDIENTTANIQPQDSPQKKDSKDEKKHKKTKVKSKRKIQRSISPVVDSDDSEQALIKPAESIKVLESSLMPARALRLTYKLVNTETKLLHRLLQAHGLQEAAPDARDFALLWAGLHPKPDVLRSLGPNQRVNHFPRSYELTRKDKLFKNIEKMQYFRGFKNFDFIPTTFLMPGEYKELCSAHHRTKGPWIVKPAASSRGRGIYIVNTPEQIPSGESVVVAKYIDRPLLVGGHKCDLRLYVCLAAADPLLLYLYEEGLVRLAAVKYDRADTHLWNPCMHLCNYSINKYHTDYVKCDDPNAGNIGHKWTLSALLRHLRKQGRDTGALMAAIEDLVVKSILSSAHTIAAAARVFVPGHFNCFELFGYDILIDEMLKPWLLEINLSPSLACESPLDARVKSALLADTLTLVGLPAAPAPPADPARAHHPRLRIGAAGAGGGGTAAGAGAGLTGEELRLVRAVRAQYSRRGGFVRIFPSQNSWQKYSQYLDPVSGIPVCSTSLNNSGGYAVVQHNYNLLVHTHVLPHFRHAAALSDTPERLKRYEAVSIAGAAPPVQLGEGTRSSPARDPRDPRQAKELIKRHLADGLRLTPGEGRRLFGLYLTHVLKRLAGAGELAAQHAGLVLRFLRRACSSLRMPYQVQGPPPKMCDKDRCAVIAKQLNDFLYMYYRETDLYTDSEDKSGCVPNIHFAQFLSSASEADLEDVLLVVLRHDQYVATFLSDGRAGALCVDVPPARRPAPPAPPPRHTLLRLLAALTHVNCRRYRPEPAPEPSPGGTPAALLSSDVVVKDSLKEEKPLTLALKYAKS